MANNRKLYKLIGVHTNNELLQSNQKKQAINQSTYEPENVCTPEEARQKKNAYFVIPLVRSSMTGTADLW